MSTLRRLRAADRRAETQTWWIVYFAPSAAAFVTPILREHFALGCDAAEGARAVSRIAAIGPTTSIFLRETLQLRVDVTSPKPSPESLVAAIAATGE